MRKCGFTLALLILFTSCNREKKDKNSEEFKIPKQSEMAALMNEMFNESEKIKQTILKGESPKSYPDAFAKIYTATLTDPSDRDEAFKLFSDQYLINLRDVFKVNKDSLRHQFNQTINSCIACHQTTCLGPIPRIQKLFIK